MAKKNILLLAGDGIGPEIMEEAKKLGVTKLIALVKIENKSSNKIFEKNNFKHVMSWLEKEI